jgi:hypothetical protein
MTIGGRFDDVRAATFGQRSSDSDEGVLPEATVVEIPTAGDRETLGVSRTQVVCVGVAFARQIIEPDLRAAVVVGQRDRSAFGTSRT